MVVRSVHCWSDRRLFVEGRQSTSESLYAFFAAVLVLVVLVVFATGFLVPLAVPVAIHRTRQQCSCGR